MRRERQNGERQHEALPGSLLDQPLTFYTSQQLVHACVGRGVPNNRIVSVLGLGSIAAHKMGRSGQKYQPVLASGRRSAIHIQSCSIWVTVDPKFALRESFGCAANAGYHFPLSSHVDSNCTGRRVGALSRNCNSVGVMFPKHRKQLLAVFLD